jgi:Zn-dependent protease with chaperone function
MEAKDFRHAKERSYYTISSIFAVLLHICTLGIFYIITLIMAIPLWISQQLFKAQIFGHAVKVTEKQFPKIYKIIQKQKSELNIKKDIEVFIYNGQGIINAFAIRLFTGRYIILMSSLVDLMLKREAYPELEFIIGHELAHHALMHTSVTRNLFLFPTKFIPFLNLAYSRGCEYSADRIGFELTKYNKRSIRGLLSITSGSEALADSMNIEEFVVQENRVPSFFGFLANIFSTHPRMTLRVKELMPLLDSISENVVSEKKTIIYDESRYMPK